MNLEYLQSVIKRRPVAILAHGASLQGLENHIEEYKDTSMCWMGLGLFTTHEKYILSKINKQLDIVFDCATVPESRVHYYELARLGRIDEFLQRKQNNLWVTTHGLIRDSVIPHGEYVLDNKQKILQVDSLFPASEIGFWMDVPNSLTLAIATALAGGASRIFIFGLDGYKGTLKSGVKSYYKPEYHERERLLALGSIEDPGINRDTDNFEKRISAILLNYLLLFHNRASIYNVSPNSLYTSIEKIGYDKVKERLYG